MTTDIKLRHGTTEWFEMVGTLMSEAASRSGLSPDLNLTFVERYTDGVELANGLVQGIRFDIVNGEPSFRIGAQQDESADINIELTAAAARKLNSLYSADPNFPVACDQFLSSGEMRVKGDPSQLGKWMEEVHDPIVDRTK